MMNKINFLFFITIGFPLVCFDVYKSANATFTYDESFSYLHYVHQSIMEIISYKKTDAANNHILNTLLMKLFEFFFGNSELALRLPNILAHILYIVFTFKLFNRYSPKYFIPFFILANANPYLLDFFSLARGYGLAVGLMSAGFYFYCRFIENQKQQNHILSLAFIGFSVLANFAMLNVFLILILIHNIFQFIIYRQPISLKNIWRTNKINIAFTIIFFLLLYNPIHIMVRDKLIVVGLLNGFLNDTVGSLIYYNTYYQPYYEIFYWIQRIFIIIFSLVFIQRSIKYFWRRDNTNLPKKFVLLFGMTIFFIVISTILQHKLFDTPFLMGRVAIFIYPLFVTGCCFIVEEIEKKVYKIFIAVVLFSTSAIFFFHTCFSLNTNWYHEWRYGTIINAKTMLSELNQMEDKTQKPINLGVSWSYEPTVNFYRKRFNLENMNEVGNRGIDYTNNFFLVNQEDWNRIPTNETEVIYYDEDTKSYLAKHSDKNSFTKSINIKAANQKFLCADTYNKSLIFANRDIPDLWETFSISELEGNKIAIRAFNYYFLCSELNRQNEITATRSVIGEWETFAMIELDSITVAFKASNEKYLSLNESTLQIVANADFIGENETFKLIMK